MKEGGNEDRTERTVVGGEPVPVMKAGEVACAEFLREGESGPLGREAFGG